MLARSLRNDRGFTAFIALLGIALIAAAGIGLSYFGAALKSSARVSQNETDIQQMRQTLRILTTLMTDGDNDGTLEPPAFASGGGPTDGGIVPSTIPGAKSSPWGTPYGYCAWNNGTNNGASTGLLAGAGTGITTAPMVALISTGPDKIFQTQCADIVASGSAAAKGDDKVLWLSVAEAIQYASQWNTEASGALDYGNNNPAGFVGFGKQNPTERIDAVGNIKATGTGIFGVPCAIASGCTGASTAPGARTNLGLQDMAIQASNNVAITGGLISVTGVSASSDASRITIDATNSGPNWTVRGIGQSYGVIGQGSAYGLYSVGPAYVSSDLTVGGNANVSGTITGAANITTGKAVLSDPVLPLNVSSGNAGNWTSFFSGPTYGTYTYGGTIGAYIANASGYYAYLAYSSWALNSNGNVIAGAYYYQSDRTLKEHIKPLTSSLDRIRELRGVEFDWTPDRGGKHDIGVIAQEVSAVYPDLVTTNDDGKMAVKYGNLVAPLIEATKELATRSDKSAAETASLRAENESLKADLRDAKNSADKALRQSRALTARLSQIERQLARPRQ